LREWAEGGLGGRELTLISLSLMIIRIYTSLSLMIIRIYTSLSLMIIRSYTSLSLMIIRIYTSTFDDLKVTILEGIRRKNRLFSKIANPLYTAGRLLGEEEEGGTGTLLSLAHGVMACYTIDQLTHSTGTVLFRPVLRIRIHRIHMFLSLPDPDPPVRGMDPDPALDPDPNPSIIMQT
jgi:hypothetical protein